VDIRALLGIDGEGVERIAANVTCDHSKPRPSRPVESASPPSLARDDPPMRARAVVLDFFGTLARATASVGIDEILERHGYTMPAHLQEMWWSGDIDGTEHVEQSRSRDHYLAWQQERLVAMLHEADVHPGEHQAILADLRAGRSVRVLEAYDEVPEVLRALRDRGLTLAICSNWDWDLEPAVAETGLDGWFDTLVSSAWAGARKPHPRIYRYLLDQTGLDPAEIVFVGDTWGPDVEGPLAAGMTPAYLERAGHWPDATRPADTSAVDVVRLHDLRGVLELVGAN
jgi:putative hydrolase of the HAD superfamily